MRTIYLNGAYVPETNGKVSVFDRGFLFSDSVYEVVSVLGGKLVDFEGHVQRLARSLGELGIKNEPLLELAMELERIALEDEYFVERKLYPNVDFYTGVIYKAMGFPPRMSTVLFAIGRLPGWIAHWREMNQDPATRIGRPQQLYIGAPERHV